MSVLVGKQAPDFTVPAVLADGQIVDFRSVFLKRLAANMPLFSSIRWTLPSFAQAN